MNSRTSIFAILVMGFLGTNHAALAAPFVGIRASLSARDALVEDFATGKADRAGQAVLNEVVLRSLDALAREGNPETAAEYREIWEKEFSTFLSIRFTKVGDHEPLSRYLSKLIPILKGTLGKNSKYADLLSDINLLNYAIPVVFAPQGEWKRGRSDRADRIEYSKHFIPFAGIVTFYTTNGACRAIAAKYHLDTIGAKLCPKIASRLENEMQTRLAPKLSDFIFNRANGIRTLLMLTRSDYAYLTVDALNATLY